MQRKLKYFEDFKVKRESAYAPFEGAEPKLRAQLNTALSALPEKYQRVLFNKYVRGVDTAELSAEMGVSQQRVRFMSKVALQRVEKSLLKRKVGRVYAGL